MLLMTNVDDVPGERVPDIIEGLMAQGAKSVHVVPALTKKGRSELIFLIDAQTENAEGLAGYLSLELGTIGVRALETSHFHFNYRFVRVKVEYQTNKRRLRALVRVKLRYDKQGKLTGAKADHDDLSVMESWFDGERPHLSAQTLKLMVEQSALWEKPCLLGDLRIEICEEDKNEKSAASIG